MSDFYSEGTLVSTGVGETETTATATLAAIKASTTIPSEEEQERFHMATLDLASFIEKFVWVFMLLVLVVFLYTLKRLCAGRTSARKKIYSTAEKEK